MEVLNKRRAVYQAQLLEKLDFVSQLESSLQVERVNIDRIRGAIAGLTELINDLNAPDEPTSIDSNPVEDMVKAAAKLVNSPKKAKSLEK